MRDERGSVLVMTLILILVLMLIISGMGWLLKNELRMTRYSQDRLITTFKLAAAVSRVRAFIRNNPEAECSQLEEISGSIIEEGDFWVESARLETGDEQRTYRIQVAGQTGELQRQESITIISGG